MTSVTANANFSSDRIWLNGKEEPAGSGRLASCLASVRAAANSGGATLVPTAWCVHICSENNFPTAAGLASSAAGSACRSVLGGFVRWHMGNREDGVDSIATQLAPASHWPGMRVLICVASDMQKKTSSSLGMRNSVKTSELLKYRAEYSVPPRTDTIVKAIEERDFQSFADITIRDSNQFHAICQDTYPPCVYMNPTSHAVSSLVHQVNTHYGEMVACYTFDAGPNACIFLLEKYVGLFASLLKHFFSDRDLEFFRGNPLELETKKELLESLDVTPIAGGLKYVIHTRPGEGPEVLGEEEALLDKNGMPKHLKA